MARDYEKMNLRELAAAIRVHLRRIETDPELNPDLEPPRGRRRYYNATAYHGGRYVRVTYVSYQGAGSLAKAEAVDYLRWLDAGNVGRHYEQQREAATS